MEGRDGKPTVGPDGCLHGCGLLIGIVILASIAIFFTVAAVIAARGG